MKKLSIEEKAKAYDEAKYIMKEYLESGNAGVIAENTIKKAFPELAESEDERIRKDIIVLVEDWWDRVNKDNISTKEQMIAWLEKQGEHHITCNEEQMKVLDEVLNFAANHESSYWNNYIFETLNNLIRQLKKN